VERQELEKGGQKQVWAASEIQAAPVAASELWPHGAIWGVKK